MKLGKTLRIIVFVVPILVIALFVGAIAVLMNTDFNQYKALIAEEAKKATGRDLVIAGDLDLEISLTPAVAVSGVTLSNAKWGARPEMVKIDRFEAQIGLVSALFGVIEVKRIVLIGADILLEVDKDGRANFDFETAAAPAQAEPEKEEAKPPEPALHDTTFVRLPVVHKVVVRDSRLTFSDAKAGTRYKVGIEELTLSGDGPDDPLNLVYKGSYNDAAIGLTAALGAPSEAIFPTKPWPVDLTVEAGGATIAVKGTVADPAKAKGLDLAVAVTGDQLGDLSALAGAPVPSLGGYSLAAKLTGDLSAAIRLDGLKAALAGSDLAGRVTVKLSGKRPEISAKLASNTLDLDALAGDDGGGSSDTGGGAGQAATASDRVFPDDPLPLDGLRAVDVKLSLDAKKIVASGARLSNASLGMALLGGNLTVDPLKATVAGGTLLASLNLDGRKNVAGLALKLDIDKVDLDPLLSDMQISQDVEGLANIDIDVKGRGSTVRRIMASLDGEAGLLMGKGRMKDTVLQTMLGGPGQLLGSVLDKGRKGYTVVNCAVADFAIAKGVATARSLYLDSDSKGIVGSGTANLGTESLNLTVDPRRRKDIGKPVLPVRITGSFMAPKYRVDRKAVAQKLTKLLGKNLPGGLLGGQDDLDMPAGGACAPPAPAAAAQPATQPTAKPAIPTTREEAIDRAEDEVKKRLKGLFGQ